MQREERAVQLCRKLTAEVASVCPKGLGAWEPAWEIVAEPSGRLLDLLHEWERTGDRETALRVKAAYGEVVEAWRTAGERFMAEMQGTPDREPVG